VGTVFLAQDEQTKQRVAAKVIDLEKYPHQYLSEVCTLSVCNHRCMVSLLDCQISLENKIGYLFLEYLPFPTLEETISKSKNGLGEKLSLEILSQLVSTLRHMHKKQISHHDLNPENILFNNESGKVKVIDFGLSVCFEKNILMLAMEVVPLCSCQLR